MSTPVVGIVGPCAAGKSTLAEKLLTVGYSAKHIAQEHSYVSDMWKRITDPSILIYLQVSYPVTLQRRRLNWNFEEYKVQIDRLRHARKYADLVIDTDKLSIDSIFNMVHEYLQTHGVEPSLELKSNK